MHRLLALLCAATFAFLLLVRSAWCIRVADSTPGNEAPVALSTARLQGVGSCASTACHGDTSGVIKHGEYSIWINRDPHAEAYQVLYNERSDRMVENLYGTNAKPAHQTALCLECHALNLPPGQEEHRFFVEDGVGCEQCHGPAEHWRTEHYLPSWRLKSAEEKEALGMRQTKNLAVRAEVCANCHVGSGDGDVNHDLIAAGHPRLNFEFGLFTAKMPRHWSAREEKQRDPDFEAKVWAIGQLQSEVSALELLASRAQGAANGKKPWPEFAEYSCAACHHALRGPNVSRGLNAQPGQRGDAPWGTWYHALTPLLPNAAENKALTQLRGTMAARTPDSARVASEARAAAVALRKQARELQMQPFESNRIQELLRLLAGQGANAAVPDWETAAQAYLGVGALYHGLTDVSPNCRDAVIRQALSDLLSELEPRTAYDGTPQVNGLSFQQGMRTIKERLRP